MASLEQPSGHYRVILRHAGRRYTHNLKTNDQSVAEGLKGGIERTLKLLDQKLLKVPDGVDTSLFIVNHGQVEQPAGPRSEDKNGNPPKDITLRELKDHDLQAHPAGTREQNSLDSVQEHLRHFIKSFGVNFSLRSLTLAKLQDHVNRRAKQRGIRQRSLSVTRGKTPGRDSSTERKIT